MLTSGAFDRLRTLGGRLYLERLAAAPGIGRGIDGDVEARAGQSREVVLRGVVCGVCASRAQAALAGVPGMEGVHVDLVRSRATLRYGPGARPDAAALRRAIEGAAVGMPARRWLEQGLLWVRGMRMRGRTR